MLPAEEAEALARIALDAMDSEPVAWINGCNKSVPAALRYLAENPRPIGGESSFNTAHLYQLAREIELMAEAPLYRHAQPAPERDQVRREHAEWSQATFGNVGPVGPLKHLSKEALEAAEQPGDLSEWADMQFLLWDAQRRAGVTDEQITQAMIDKLAVNKQRKWPEPKDGEPRLHIKEQPAPVVPDSYVMVPMRLTAENGAKGALSGEFSETKFVNCPECFGDDECETCDGSGRIEITVPVTWTTIKEIWAKGVEHFSATAQENN
nr:DUF550 domain-containing protein [Klebsiella pneumoniae]